MSSSVSETSFGAPKIETKLLSIRTLLSYCTPTFQRSVQREHVEQIAGDVKADWERFGGQLSVQQTISVASYASSDSASSSFHYLLDGQHRMRAFAQLISEGVCPGLEEATLPTVIYQCASKEEIMFWYARINHHLPIHPMELELEWSDKVKPLFETITRRWRTYLSKSANCRIPNIHLVSAMDAFKRRASDLHSEAVTSERLLRALDDFHGEILRRIEIDPALQMNKRLLECRGKSKDDPCFLGYWRSFQWVDFLIRRCTEHFAWETAEWRDLDDAVVVARKTITRILKNAVWSKCNDVDSMRGKCYVCEHELHRDDMECGHDIAHCFGGKDTVDNLYPICRACNRDMGVQGLHSYKSQIQDLQTVDD
jgi:hypothetical protein